MNINFSDRQLRDDCTLSLSEIYYAVKCWCVLRSAVLYSYCQAAEL